MSNSSVRARGFEKAEASLRLEGMDPSGGGPPGGGGGGGAAMGGGGVGGGGGGALVPFRGIPHNGPPAPLQSLSPYSFTPPPRAL